MTSDLPPAGKKVRNSMFIPHFPLPTAAGVCVAYGGLKGFFFDYTLDRIPLFLVTRF
jgi:hypothetical protein